MLAVEREPAYRTLRLSKSEEDSTEAETDDESHV